MSGPASCEVIGCWRIVVSDLWDREYLDLAGPAYLQIGAEGWAEFSFGAVDATAKLQYGRRVIFFHWSGFDEAMRSAATDRPNCRTTALSKSSCLSTTVTTPSSPPTAK